MSDIYLSSENEAVLKSLKEENDRRDAAMTVACNAGGGLLCHVYENHTEYFVDFTIPRGVEKSVFFGGRFDERDRENL